MTSFKVIFAKVKLDKLKVTGQCKISLRRSQILILTI